jgi:hypothetical protein
LISTLKNFIYHEISMIQDGGQYGTRLCGEKLGERVFHAGENERGFEAVGLSLEGGAVTGPYSWSWLSQKKDTSLTI